MYSIYESVRQYQASLIGKTELETAVSFANLASGTKTYDYDYHIDSLEVHNENHDRTFTTL